MSGDVRTDGTITYRGRSLEEVLPKIREELGPDAVIERHRTGLVGGVGGFFQREMVEVDARPARPGENTGLDVLAGEEGDDDDLRAATAPPADGAFAELLADARSDAEGLPAQGDPVRPAAPGAETAHDWDAWAEDVEEDEPAEPEEELVEDDVVTGEAWSPFQKPLKPSPHAARAYRSAGREEQPEPPAPVAPAPPPPAPIAPPPSPFAAPAPAPAPAAPEPPRAAPAPAPAPAATPAEPQAAALVEHGVSAPLARSVAAETVSHVMPFAEGRTSVKRQARSALARRIPVQSGLGGEGRTIALVGAAGAGKTRAAAGIAAAYAAKSDLPVVVATLRPRDVGSELSELLDPYGVAVRPFDDGEQISAYVGARHGRALVVIDTPAVSPKDTDAVAKLATDLRAAGVTETHVVLPATVAGPVARGTLEAFAALDPAAMLLTHTDETDHLGPLVDLAIEQRRPISYVTSGPQIGSDMALADPAALAARLLP